MPINKIAYRDGKDDFLDSNRYSPSFWLLYGSGIPQLDNALDSYAMGYELTDAFCELVGERGINPYVLTVSHDLQSWRPDSETILLHQEMTAAGIPFCYDCADWHHDDEAHSWTDKNNV